MIRARWTWVAGLAVLCGSAVCLTQVPDLKRQNAALQQKQRQMDGLLQDLSRTIGSSAALRTPPLASVKRLSTVTADLQLLADQSGVTVSDASYNPVDDVTVPDIGRLDITARLRGGYAPLKKMLAGLMGSYDSLALESLSVRRNRASEAILDIDVRWSFYYRKSA